MEFKEKQAIYIQIADFVCEQILLKKWQIGDKILSIRDLAINIEVNPNTVMRTYEFLQQQEIIVNKRGIGFFVAEDAAEKIVALRRKQFVEQELPALFKTMYLLQLDCEMLQKEYQQFIEKNFKSI